MSENDNGKSEEHDEFLKNIHLPAKEEQEEAIRDMANLCSGFFNHLIHDGVPERAAIAALVEMTGILTSDIVGRPYYPD